MPRKSVRYESSRKLFGWPLVSIARGPQGGESRGVARGVIAIGDVAQGVIAVGGVATGGIAIGGISAGLLAVGGVALGGLVIAGVALGFGTYGGVSIGYFGRGGVAVGAHTMSPKGHDPAAVKFFETVMPGTVSD